MEIEHGDVSIGNLMWGPIGKNGILNELDLAATRSLSVNEMSVLVGYPCARQFIPHGGHAIHGHGALLRGIFRGCDDPLISLRPRVIHLDYQFESAFQYSAKTIYQGYLIL